MNNSTPFNSNNIYNNVRSDDNKNRTLDSISEISNSLSDEQFIDQLNKE